MSLSKISIIRDRDYFGKFRKLNVYIDGNLAGGVDWGTSEEFPVASGPHTLYVKMDWCRCPPLQIIVKEGERISYRVHLPPERTWFGFPKVLFDMIFKSSHFYRLEKV